MRGRIGLLLAAIAAAMWLGTSALAADQTVNATPDNTFEPTTVTINPGETVTWHNNGGDHNVALDDGSFRNGDPSIAPWTASPRFDTAGAHHPPTQAAPSD